MLGIVIVSYNTSQLTLACLRSVACAQADQALRVVLVDNGSDALQQQALREGVAGHTLRELEYVQAQTNTGFAAASNRAIEILLDDARIRRILMLNNDAELVDGGLSALLAHADECPDADMIGAGMYRFDAPNEVDSLGIAMYASALGSNRKERGDRLLGPTGGLALYSRKMLEVLRARHGMIFDERFFCYAEDTDVALRARLLGFDTAFLDQCVALHHGQASSGGGFSDFVLYHGIRNSIWTMVKNFPLPWLIGLSPLIVALHCAIVLRHGLGGRFRLVWRLYRDACKGLPAMWRSRQVIQRTRVLSLRVFGRLLTPRFYDRAYLRQAWRELWGGRRNV